MLDWAKAIHEAIGIESPKLFIGTFAIFGLLLFGLAGWIIDRGYRVKLREQLVHPATTQIDAPTADQHSNQPGETKKTLKESQQGDRSVKIGDKNQFTNSPIVTGDNNHISILTAPGERRLESAQKDRLVTELARFSKPTIEILTVNSSKEVETLADDFEAVIKRLEWRLKSRAVSLVPSHGTGLGVYVRSQSEHPAAADNLITILRSMGFPVEAAVASDLGPDDLRLFVSSP